MQLQPILPSKGRTLLEKDNIMPPESEPTINAWSCLAATQGLCNHCGRLVDAQIRIEQDRVVLVKWCPDHGTSRGLISSDVQWYLESMAYIKPGTRPLEKAVPRFDGCPTSCGLCPQHQQHTCVPIIEITSQCNLNCPICLVKGRPIEELSLPRINEIMDNLVRYEGRLNMLTLSGGEPTMHPQFLEVVDACMRPEVGIVSVSTNGILLQENDDLIKALRDRGVVIALQFDGFRPETYNALRGAPDLAASKQRLINRLLDLDARFSLTVTLAKNVNEDELGNILALLFAHETVLSVMVQPLAHTTGQTDPMNVITIPDAVKLLVQGSGDVLKDADFSPLPCSHPSCFALTYLLKTKAGELVSLPSIIPAQDYLDIIKNQALFGTDMDSLRRVKDALYALWSSDGIVPQREAVLKIIKGILKDLNQLGPAPPHREVLELGTSHVKSIFIHHFMGRADFDLSRAVKCCNHYPQTDYRLLPACVRNNIKLELCGTPSETI